MISRMVVGCSLILATTVDVSAEQKAKVAKVRFTAAAEPPVIAEDFAVPIISVGTKGPQSIESDEPADYTVKIRNVSSKKDATVLVVVNYPAAAGFVSADPAPTAQREGELEYHIDNLARLTEQDLKITLLAPEEGEINLDVVATLQADNHLQTAVKRPMLRFDVDSPPVGRLGEKIPFELMIKNTGDGIVRDAHVFADLPEGLTVDPDSVDELLEAFSINAGTEKKVTFNILATKAGAHDVRFRLNMGNVASQAIQTSLAVAPVTTDLHFAGPAQHVIGSENDYSLIIENNNQYAIENAELDLEIPSSIQITKISRFADYLMDDKKHMHLSWPVEKIAPGERLTIRIRAKAVAPKEAVCNISIRYDDGSTKNSKYSIQVVNAAAKSKVQSAQNVDLTIRTGNLNGVLGKEVNR